MKVNMRQCVPPYVSIAVLLVFNAVVVTTAPISGANNDNGKTEDILIHPHEELNEEAPIPYRNLIKTELIGRQFPMADTLMRTDFSPAEFDLDIVYADSQQHLNKFEQAAERHVSKRHDKECDLNRITVEMLIRFFKTGHFCSAKTVRFRFGVAK